MRFAVLLLASFLAAPVLSAQHTVPSGGQWLIEPGERSGIVRLTIRYGERRHSDSWNSQDDLPMSQLVGLSAADMGGAGVTVHFKIVRSAGTLTCEGWFDDGKGSGHFTYQPNPDFVAELAKRGINAPPPTAWEQFQMTMAVVGLDLVDELARQKYDRPTASELARMGTHGVDLEYVRDIGARGYHLRDAASLVRMRDHGVDPDFIESLSRAGFKDLSAEELVRLRDHGVDPEFIASLDSAGYKDCGRRLAKTYNKSVEQGRPTLLHVLLDVIARRLCLTVSGRQWPGPESNRRHADFQSAALPTELPGRAMQQKNLAG